MAQPDLHVRFGREIVGHLHGNYEDELEFRYDAAWLERADRFPVSLSLPLRDEAYAGGAGHWFFANLLPEGGVRDAICRRLGISIGNDLALLRAIGGECAGALSIAEPERAPAHPDDYQYEPLDDRRLQALVSDDSVVPLLVGGATTRLSLAGAQHKVPVAVLDGKIHLPLMSAPSTHILKLPHARYTHIPVNEAFVLGLAARVGLAVPNAELLHRTDPPSLLVERYDRIASDDPWPVMRMHQEDLCQALGLPPTRKYEQEGGPTLATVIELVRSNVRQPLVDVPRLLEWQAFNVVAGNSDGHGKNLSILYAGGATRLAPFYDLLSTRAYPQLDRQLAMGVGGRRDPDQLDRAQWSALAAELGIGVRVVIDLVAGVAGRCEHALTAWAKEFKGRHGEQSMLQTLPTAIRRRARRLTRALAT